MEYRELERTGLKVSAFSLGASSLAGMFHPIEEANALRTVHQALDLGINFFDVSPAYGSTLAETVLGKALQGIARDRYFMATKVGSYGKYGFDFSAARVTASVDESLSRLGIDYIDLIQVHDMEHGSLDQVVTETIPALRKLQASGKVRFIGITGLPLKIFRYVLERTQVDTILSYCHYTLADSSLTELIPEVQAKGVGIISASPLAMGLLTEHGLPSWHPSRPPVREACARAAAHCRAQGVDIAQLAIQFSVANPAIATTLVSTANPENIAKNVAWLSAPPNPQLLAEVQAILAPVHNQTWVSGRPENN